MTEVQWQAVWGILHCYYSCCTPSINKLFMCSAVFPISHGTWMKRFLTQKWRKVCKQKWSMLEIWTTLLLFENYYHWLSGLGLTLTTIILVCIVKEKQQLLGLLEVGSYYTVHTNMKVNHVHISEGYFNAQDCMDCMYSCPIAEKRSLKHKQHY